MIKFNPILGTLGWPAVVLTWASAGLILVTVAFFGRELLGIVRRIITFVKNKD